MTATAQHACFFCGDVRKGNGLQNSSPLETEWLEPPQGVRVLVVIWVVVWVWCWRVGVWQLGRLHNAEKFETRPS